MRRDQLPAAQALGQILCRSARWSGPALAGLLIAHVAGIAAAYWVDVGHLRRRAPGRCSLMRAAARPRAAAPGPGWRSIVEGLRYLRGRQALQGTFLIDINAMVFGMPRALFPALAARTVRRRRGHGRAALRRARRRRPARRAHHRLGRRRPAAGPGRDHRGLVWGAAITVLRPRAVAAAGAAAAGRWPARPTSSRPCSATRSSRLGARRAAGPAVGRAHRASSPAGRGSGDVEAGAVASLTARGSRWSPAGWPA